MTNTIKYIKHFNKEMNQSFKPKTGSLFMAGVVLFILLLPFLSAATENVKLYETTDLKFTCTLNNAIPSAAATYNITLSSPNGTTLLNNVATTSQGNGAFNYTYEFTQIGLYKVQMFCTDGTYSFSNEGFYDVTATGKDLTSAKATSYIIIFIISFIIFIGLLLVGIYLPSNNKSDAMTGYILAVSNLKYVKIFSLCLAYLVAMFISYFAWMVSYAYLDMDFITTLFRFAFTAQVILIFPLFVIGAYVMVSNLIHDQKIGEYLSRGLSIRS